MVTVLYNFCTVNQKSLSDIFMYHKYIKKVDFKKSSRYSTFRCGSAKYNSVVQDKPKEVASRKSG